jgi:hypothetical protein
VRLSLSNELDILFSPSIRIQAQTIKPEAVDALAVNEAVGALLRLRGKDAEQVSYVSTLKPQTAVALCRWMSDPAFWGAVGGITKQ